MHVTGFIIVWGPHRLLEVLVWCRYPQFLTSWEPGIVEVGWETRLSEPFEIVLKTVEFRHRNPTGMERLEMKILRTESSDDRPLKYQTRSVWNNYTSIRRLGGYLVNEIFRTLILMKETEISTFRCWGLPKEFLESQHKNFTLVSPFYWVQGWGSGHPPILDESHPWNEVERGNGRQYFHLQRKKKVTRD